MSDLTAFARRAVATRVWRWIGGMTARPATTGPRGGYKRAVVFKVFVDDGSPVTYDFHRRIVPASYVVGDGPIPDLTDPATLGCIEHAILAPLGVVVEREHYGGRLLHRWLRPETMRHGEWTESLPEALVLGLEAASAVEEGR